MFPLVKSALNRLQAFSKQWQGRATRNVHLIFMTNTVMLY
uniref:Cytochrome c oxidase subunit 7B n=1 Tax=Homo sapiens TaxID=9606 RepID=A0A3B3ISY5_HUMAN